MTSPTVTSTGPRILLCTADVGCGHGRAAAAIALALRGALPGSRVPVLDALQFTPAWFNLAYRDGYLFAIRRLPKVVASLYRKTDFSGIPGHDGTGPALEAMALGRLARHEAVDSADAIVCTHFLVARYFSRLKSLGRIKASLGVVVTDQHPHAIWRSPNVDRYFVASESARLVLTSNGVKEDRITSAGIPIDQRFATPLSQKAARAKHSLPEDRPIVLFSGGGLGLGGLDVALEAFLSQATGSFGVVVCGKNTNLNRVLAARAEQPGWKDRCRIVGHTIHMHELMAAADLMVCKPGGLTTSEATAMGMPMVLLPPIPGQEEHNAQRLVESGAALAFTDPAAAGHAARALASDIDALARHRKDASALGRAGSAEAIASVVLKELCGSSTAIATANQFLKSKDVSREVAMAQA